jgi:hypothetical protein
MTIGLYGSTREDDVVGIYADRLPGCEKGDFLRRDVSRVGRHHVHVYLLVAMTRADEKEQPARNRLLELRPERDMKEEMFDRLLCFL